MKKPAYRFWLVFAATAWSVQPGHAVVQVWSVTIKGTVTDPSGAVVDEARLVIQQKQTGARRVVDTDHAGLYRLESLEPGEYELQVSKAGFGTALYGLSLRAGDHLT